MKIKNGNCIGSNSYDSKIACFCDQGFFISSIDSDEIRKNPKKFEVVQLTCNSNGFWSDSFPTCSRNFLFLNKF